MGWLYPVLGVFGTNYTFVDRDLDGSYLGGGGLACKRRTLCQTYHAPAWLSYVGRAALWYLYHAEIAW